MQQSSAAARPKAFMAARRFETVCGGLRIAEMRGRHSNHHLVPRKRAGARVAAE